VMAFVVPRAEPPAPEDLIEFVVDRLPYYAVPRFVELVDELPRTVALRPDKQALRERVVTDATWDREAAGIRLRRERL
jgi:crotonobetaine/carnitine-CoA ligase